MGRRARYLLAFPLIAVALALASCDGDEQASPEPTTTQPTTAPSESDGYVPPYSPSPTPFKETQYGFAGETLTLPTADGGKLYATVWSTAMTLEQVDGVRSLSVWMTFENPEETNWTGVPAAFAKLTDENGAEYRPVPTRLASELYPDPGRYGYSNRDLHERLTIRAGGKVDGVVVFRPSGGNRPVQVLISEDRGTTWGTWVTNLGIF